jgi:hypothetical protein
MLLLFFQKPMSFLKASMSNTAQGRKGTREAVSRRAVGRGTTAVAD